MKKDDNKKSSIKSSEDKKSRKKEKKSKKMSREELVEMNEECENRFKRALADYQNLLKQSAKEKTEIVKYANSQLIIEIIPVYNNLKIAMDSLREEDSGNGWVEGVKYVIKQFEDILTNAGVEKIETIGKEFDHNTMEAVEGKGEKVVKEVTSGYKLNDKVIIPARVVVEK